MGARLYVILRWCAFILLVLPAVLRVLILISPDPYFSFDPLQVPLSSGGLGPCGSMILDSCSVLGCALALLSEVMRGRLIDMKVLILAIVPIGVIIYHVIDGPSSDGVMGINGGGNWLEWLGGYVRNPENLMTGSAWTAAVLTGVGAFHLARDPRMRILLVGAVVALVVPLAVKGLYQVTVEHGLTVRGFEQSKDAILRANGWEPGSVEAKMFERRLMQPEATGWFGLSNVFGSFMACFVVFWMSMTLAAARTKLSSGWIGLLGLVTAAATTGLAITFSKGAIGAGVFGVLLSLGVMLPRRYRKKVLPWTFAMSVSVMILATAAVVLRGVLLGASFTADGYSLLFRWYYWEGAMRAFYHHWIAGVGPEGFKSAYIMYKPILSPEEVASPHHVFVSFISMLGVVGMLWIAFVLLLVKRSSPMRLGGEEVKGSAATSSDGAIHIADQSALIPAVVMGVVLLVLSWWLNRGSSYPDFVFLFWPMAMAGYVGLIAILPWLGKHSSWLLLRWSVWAGITVVLLHSQIEMTMTRISAGAAIFLLLGAGAVDVGGGGGLHIKMRETSQYKKLLEWGAVGVVFLIWLVHGFAGVVPVTIEAGALARAAMTLSEVGAVRQELASTQRAEDIRTAMDGMEKVAVHLKDVGVDPRIEGRMREMKSSLQMGDNARFRQVSGLALVDLQFAVKKLELIRIGGGDEKVQDGAVYWLERARKMMPYDPNPVNAEVKLWLLLARAHHEAGDTQLRDDAFDEGCTLMEEIVRLRPDLAVLKERLGALYEERARLTGETEWANRALAILQDVLKQDPYSRSLVLRMAKLADGLGRNDEAVSYYRKVLIINDNLRLDPLKVMDDTKRNSIEKRIAEITGE